ncbi:MAG: DMT family transporter, partial [Candidatus Hydrothermarchaeaceae archaeon]
MSRDNTSMGLLLLLIASLIWSTTPVFSKLVYQDGLHPLLLVEFRLLMGFLFLLAIGKDPRSSRGSYRDLVKLSVFGLGANYLVYHFSVYYTTASSAQVLEGTAPVFVLVFAFLMREEAVTPRKAAGVLLALMGTLLIFYSHFQRTFMVGDFLGVLAGLTWAYFIVQGSRTLKTIAPADSLVFLFGFSALLLAPFALSLRLVLSAKVALMVFSMGFLHTFAAYLLYFRGIKLTTPITAGVIFALNPLITVYLSKILL